MQGSNRKLVVTLTAVLTLSACSGTATTTTLPPTTVAPTTTTTTTPPTTTTAAPTTTTAPAPTTLPEGTVGDPAALQALAEEVARESLIPIEEFFIPDITQPDPVEALKELLAYSDWMSDTFPDKELTRIHTLDNSPARTAQENFVDPLETQGLVTVAPSPLSFTDFETVPTDALPTTDSTRAGIPAASVAIRFSSSSAGYDLVDEETGEIVDSVPAWDGLTVFVVVTPTQYGWQEYWYGTP